MPGGPSTHLPDAAISASNGVVRASMAIARERAHRVDDEAPAVALHDGGDLRQRVEDAGRRLAVDEPDVRDRRIRREQPVDVLRRRRHVLGGLERRHLAAHHLRELGEPRAVGAVDQHQHVAVARDQRVDRRLDRERAAALHRHADVGVLAVDDVEQLAPHFGRDRVEVRVPRAPVAQHRRLRGERRRDGARRQQDRIAREEAHGILRWMRVADRPLGARLQLARVL